jgi:hypothetical protein
MHLSRVLAATAALFYLLPGWGLASDLSIFEFPEGIYAMAALGNRIHRLQMPGGKVLSTEALGGMARVDVEEGVNLVASVPRGIAGRQVHLDMGRVDQIELGRKLAIVTGAAGTAVYFPGTDQLVGVQLSEGYPRGIMVYRDIAALRWGEQVSLYGSIRGRVIQFVFPAQDLTSIHLGEDTVVTTWAGRGTYLHTLTPQGFQTIFLSSAVPGNLSARGGKSVWMPVRGHKEGSPLAQPLRFQDPPKAPVPVAFRSLIPEGG